MELQLKMEPALYRDCECSQLFPLMIDSPVCPSAHHTSAGATGVTMNITVVPRWKGCMLVHRPE
jgi:hypothetical protein